MIAKSKVVENQSDSQFIVLVKTLLATQKGREFDGIQAANFIRDTYGIDTNWHSCVDVLEVMTRTKEATCTQAWGMSKYLIGYSG